MDYFQQDFTATTASSSSDDAFANAFDLPLPSRQIQTTSSSSVRQMTDDLNQLRKTRSALSLKQTEQKKIKDVLYRRPASRQPLNESSVEEKYQYETDDTHEEDEDLRRAIEESLALSNHIEKDTKKDEQENNNIFVLQTLHQHIATNIVTERYRADRSKLDTYFQQLLLYVNKLQSYDPVISIIYHSWDYMLSVVNDCGQKILLDIYVITAKNVYKSSLHYERGWSSSPWMCHTTDLLQSRIYTFNTPIVGYTIDVFRALTAQNGHLSLGVDHYSTDRNESFIRHDRTKLEKIVCSIYHTLPGIDLLSLPREWKEIYNEKRCEYLYLNETTADCITDRPTI